MTPFGHLFFYGVQSRPEGVNLMTTITQCLSAHAVLPTSVGFFIPGFAATEHARRSRTLHMGRITRGGTYLKGSYVQD